MKAVFFYSVWILTKCIDTLFGGLILFSRSHQHFEMSDLIKIGFPHVISWTEQWKNGFWSIFIYWPRREKTQFGFLTTQAQTSLRIRAVWSAPLLFTFWKVSYVNLLQVKFQFSVAQETGLKPVLSETPNELNAGFLAL